MNKYLQLGKYSKDCPKELLVEVKKIKKENNQKDYILEIFKLVKEEFNPQKHDITTTNDFKISRFISANEVYKKRQRSCGSIATVMASLLRTLGYPTKLVNGFYIKNNPQMRHAWNEVMINGKWVAIDIMRNDFKLDKYHVRNDEWVDWNDLEKEMQKSEK
ncbi:MAG: transglutaminase domain-containing protein [bacterium]